MVGQPVQALRRVHALIAVVLDADGGPSLVGHAELLEATPKHPTITQGDTRIRGDIINEGIEQVT
eukprot:3134064-Alexandrium_andersonii.AAC.1